MAKVTIVSNLSGRVRRVSERLAASLVRRGSFRFDGEPAPQKPAAAAPAGPADELDGLTVAELRERAEGMEVEGSGANGNVVKADLLRALRGGYGRRDMRAED
jgi:hypothetical protein